jgi:hypothetical protein
MDVVAVGRTRREPGREPLLGAFVIETPQRELPEVVEALAPPGRLASGLHRRQEQRHEHANNGDDHQ